jgi:ABC-type polysaccharide/polyol phosphate transport system ATPase subunit
MAACVAIELSNVSVCYRFPSERINSMKEQEIRRLKGTHITYSEFWALNKVSPRTRRMEGSASAAMMWFYVTHPAGMIHKLCARAM